MFKNNFSLFIINYPNWPYTVQSGLCKITPGLLMIGVIIFLYIILFLCHGLEDGPLPSKCPGYATEYDHLFQNSIDALCSVKAKLDRCYILCICRVLKNAPQLGLFLLYVTFIHLPRSASVASLNFHRCGPEFTSRSLHVGFVEEKTGSV